MRSQDIGAIVPVALDEVALTQRRDGLVESVKSGTVRLAYFRGKENRTEESACLSTTQYAQPASPTLLGLRCGLGPTKRSTDTPSGSRNARNSKSPNESEESRLKAKSHTVSNVCSYARAIEVSSAISQMRLDWALLRKLCDIWLIGHCDRRMAPAKCAMARGSPPRCSESRRASSFSEPPRCNMF